MDFIFAGGSVYSAEVFAAQYDLQVQGDICFAKGYSSYAFSVMLADFMLGRGMELRIKSLLKKRLPELSEEKKQTIIVQTMELLQQEDLYGSIYAGRGRYARMQKEIEACLLQNPCFNAAGFERFRMHGFEQYLTALMSLELQKLLYIEEDEEYYELLRSFMKDRGSGYESIKLILKANGNYLLQGKCEYGMMSLEGGRVSGFMDMIITSLLCLAPCALEIEQEKLLPQYRLLLKDLQHIFGEKLQIL